MKPSEILKLDPTTVADFERWFAMTYQGELALRAPEHFTVFYWWVRGTLGGEEPDEVLGSVAAIAWGAGYAYGMGQGRTQKPVGGSSSAELKNVCPQCVDTGIVRVSLDVRFPVGSECPCAKPKTGAPPPKTVALLWICSRGLHATERTLFGVYEDRVAAAKDVENIAIHGDDFVDIKEAEVHS